MEAQNAISDPITTLWAPDHTRLTPERMMAFDKFLAMIEDWGQLRAVTSRIFFEFLRTRPHLTSEELDDLHALTDFLAKCPDCRAT